VSVPLTWDELSEELTSDHFTVVTLPDHLARQRQDPWTGYDQAARRLTDNMKRRLSLAGLEPERTPASGRG